MTALRKITVRVPENLLKQAQRETGEGVTETIRQGLMRLSARSAYNRMRRLRGTVHFALDVDDLRKDRK